MASVQPWEPSSSFHSIIVGFQLISEHVWQLPTCYRYVRHALEIQLEMECILTTLMIVI